MGCKRALEQLDAYLDGELTGAASDALAQHVRTCADCSRLVAREWDIRRVLREDPVPEPSPGFYERALATAAREANRDHRYRWWGMGFGSAVAAGLALWFVVGVWFTTPDVDQPPAIAGVSITMNETRTVNLVFSSVDVLQDATLTVLLPPGIELAGYGGQQEIRWRTHLRKGKNVLPLELVARDDAGGELVARLEHDSKRKTFRVNVTVI